MKTKAVIGILVTGLVALVVAGCGLQEASGNPDNGVPPLDDGTKSVEIELTSDELAQQKDITREIEVKLPGSVIVILGSNPTTGFDWQDAEIGDEAVLTEYFRQFVEPQSDVVGAPGKDVWTFKTLKTGTTTVKFEYSRPWEGGEKGEYTVELTITVK